MPKKPSATISKISFSGGDTFQLNPNEKIIIVGPNNSGKSQSLCEIMAITQNGAQERTVVVTELEIEKNGSSSELQQFLEENAVFVNSHYRFNNWEVHRGHTQFWDHNYLINGLAAGYIKNIAANDRLTICNQQKSISPGDQKSKPQHILYDDEALMNKISLLFKRAFGKDIMFDYRGGSHLPIHVGVNPIVDGVVDRVGDTYVQSVRSNPLLDQQGDGMKSYAGILFEAIVADLDITLIDEPEAFLHPPQMRRLGETLSSEVRGQLVVATHSSDILRGFLEGTRGNVRILRIQRDNDKNVVSEASNETVKSLWDKPELRYSNALEGIFHEQTIICEDDSDCRLINSIGDHLELSSNEQWLDTAYIPTGGKHGIPKIAKTLREIGVPVKAVFDIDFLSESSLVKTSVEAFGGCWADIEPLWRRVDAAVRGGNKPKSIPEMKGDITKIINNSGDNELPKGDIIEAMKQGKPWSIVKRFGFRGIPSGDAQADYDLLKISLEDIGIYLVPVGEIENFCPQIGSHGPKFITKLLSNIPLGDPQLNDLRSFVDTVHKGKHCNLERNLSPETEKKTDEIEA